MESRALRFVVSACSGALLRGSPEQSVQRVCTDSRQIQTGDLFFALKGEKFDGHDFLFDVSSKASAVVINCRPVPSVTGDCAVIAVENTRQALGRLAARYRQDFALPVIAVSGSNGKTSTKDLIAAVLRQNLTTLWSEASYNND